MKKKYYLAYLTANENKSYIADYFNILNMTKYNPGVPEVLVYIAVSKIHQLCKKDKTTIDKIVNLTNNCSWLNVCFVIFKNNIGRDFSSASICLKEIAKTANNEDVIMIRNRSGYGPFCDSWYVDYIKQFEKSPTMGLVGSTINFAGLSDMKTKDIITHVQTYVYLSKWKHFKNIKDKYPGIKSNSHKETVIKGEIELSRYILNQGLQLSCLNWPNHIFNINFLKDYNLPQIDIKKTVKNLPITFRDSSYLRKFKNLPIRFNWFIKRIF